MILRKLNTITLKGFITLTILLSNIATADVLDALPNSPHQTATIPEIAERADKTASWFYNGFKAAGVIIGLWLVISSLIKVKKISVGESDDKALGAWFGVVIGSMVAFAAFWMWTFGKTAQDAVGASSETT